jgi:hypothetical protein
MFRFRDHRVQYIKLSCITHKNMNYLFTRSVSWSAMTDLRESIILNASFTLFIRSVRPEFAAAIFESRNSNNVQWREKYRKGT